RQRAGKIPWSRSLRGTQANRRRSRRARTARKGRCPHIESTARRSQRRRHRAVADRPVVRRCQDSGKARHSGGGERRYPVCAATVRKHVFFVDARYSGLVYFAATVVGRSEERRVGK